MPTEPSDWAMGVAYAAIAAYGKDNDYSVQAAALVIDQAVGEPVAWLYIEPHCEQSIIQSERASVGEYPYWTETPLYAPPARTILAKGTKS